MFSKTFTKKHKVHSFVSSFFFKHFQITEERFSREAIIQDMFNYIRYFSDLTLTDGNLFKIKNELQFFFNECKFIAKKRGKDIIIPKVMKYTEIVKYIEYFFVIDIDFEAELIYQKEYQKKFIETIFDELQSVVYSPKRISYWIHLGDGIDLSPYSDCSKFI